jgi:hypothetical protein
MSKRSRSPFKKGTRKLKVGFKFLRGGRIRKVKHK